MSSADTFKSELSRIIDILQEYQPGTITKENVEILCQILGLETFTDNLSANAGTRLSIASKIIVIDIDFDNSETPSVKDTKLVLASNFENFNYYNDDNKTNILFNSLKCSKYTDLTVFTKNLKFLKMLDAYSNTSYDSFSEESPDNGETLKTEPESFDNDSLEPANHNDDELDKANFTNGTAGFPLDKTKTMVGKKSTSSGMGSVNKSPDEKQNSFDLFRYYTYLTGYLRDYFKEFQSCLKISSNDSDKFGIYFTNALTNKVLMRLTIAEVTNADKPLMQFQYKDDEWVCSNPTKSILGLGLVLEVINPSVLFTEHLIPTELILDSGDLQTFGLPVLLDEASTKKFSNQVQITFTSKFQKIHKIDVSNDNLNYLKDIIKWGLWYDSVLVPSFNNCIDLMKNKKSGSKVGNHRHSVTHTERKPSVSIMKDEGIAELNMHDLLKTDLSSEDVIMEEEPLQIGLLDKPVGQEEQANDFTPGQQFAKVELPSEQHAMIVSEDYVFTQGKGSINFYDDDIFNWFAFMSGRDH